MFEFNSTLAVEMKSMTLHGNGVAENLVHIIMDTHGAGLSSFDHMSFMSATNLVKCARQSSENTCADLVFNQCSFKDATYGLQVLNGQGVNYNFIQCSFNGIESAIKMVMGNHVYMTLANFANCGDDLNGKYTISIDNAGDGSYTTVIDSVRFEQNCENFFYGSNYGATVINSLTEAQSSSATNKVKLEGHNLTINNSLFSSWDNLFNLTSRAGKSAELIVNNTYFLSQKSFSDIKDLLVLDSNSRVYISLKGCKVANSKYQPTLIQDFYSNIKLGPVAHECIIIGNGVSKNAYLFSETNQNYYNTLELYNGTSYIETIIQAENENGDKIGAVLSGIVIWDGTTATIISSTISGKYSTNVGITFNTASFISSVRG